MFGIACYQPKHEENVGTLFRSAYLYDAISLNTIGRKYRRQSSDTVHSCKHIDYFHFESFDKFREFWKHKGYHIIGVELDKNAISLENFEHPDKTIYVMGNEVYGIHQKNLDKCDKIVKIPTKQPISMNMAVAGSIVLADRHMKTIRSPL